MALEYNKTGKTKKLSEVKIIEAIRLLALAQAYKENQDGTT